MKENTYWDSTSITHNKELLSTKIINSSGSNSNGSWIKFEDGTMIEYGINYGVNNSYRLITFPIKFTSLSIVLSTINAYADNYIYNSVAYDFNNENCKVVVFYAVANGGSWSRGGNQFSWLAIGKWK